jgi:hypothetical protein
MANQQPNSYSIPDYRESILPDEALPSRRIPAWLLSFVLHTLLFVAILLAWRSVPRGASKVEDRSGGIVLVDLQSTTTEYLTEGEVEEADTAAVSDQSPPPLASEAELPPELPGLDSNLSPIVGAGAELADALPGADALIDTPSLDLKIGGKVTTEVFGIKGTGSRFVYVFDRSKSMEGYQARPLLAAKQELLQSLASLGDNHQFQIIFYNDSVRPFNPDGLSAMYFATEEKKREALNFVRSIRGDSGTDHLNALRFALRLSPDVVFLLTDAEGGFTAAELRQVSGYNRSGAVINAIEFGERRGGDRSLATLARENGGQYIFKNIRTLQIDGK